MLNKYLLNEFEGHQHLLFGILPWPNLLACFLIPQHIPHISARVMVLKYKFYVHGFLSIKLSSGTWWTWPLHFLVSSPPQPVFLCFLPFSNMLSSFFFPSFLLVCKHVSLPWLCLCILKFSEISLKGVLPALSLCLKLYWPVFPFPSSSITLMGL